MLQEILERQVPYIPCQGHRSNTFNEHCKRNAKKVAFGKYYMIDYTHQGGDREYYFSAKQSFQQNRSVGIHVFGVIAPVIKLNGRTVKL